MEKDMPQLHLTLETEIVDEEDTYEPVSPLRLHKKPYNPSIKLENIKEVKIEKKVSYESKISFLII